MQRRPFAHLKATFQLLREANLKLKPKKCRLGVRSFLGFCNYYRRFVKDFAGIASPLSSLTKKKVPFIWNDECQTAFDRLRKELITAPVLEFPDYTGTFILDTDASNTSLGAVLSNVINGEERPLVYASRVLSKTKTNYSTTKREALAVVQAVKWFKPYIWGGGGKICPSHRPLQPSMAL